MAASNTPTGLGAGGRDLWTSITDDHELDAAQKVTLLEACRSKDRLDKLDDVLRGDGDTWMKLYVDPRSEDGTILELRVTQALAQANSTANLLKQLLAALRLPDVASGKRPQQRGGARGAYSPTSKNGAKVSSLDKARAAKSS
ncbi:hypothetical protein [Terrabacter sp. C0L_2]|uniref:hypothetical protein n=1 Tax=Terrabacter sp. C0L_2 TaxID=3108389 RepID=UPI002ED15AD7|nr:hypothetical protein U5C87_17740 [Terrabacter sp. C0L_2]